MSFFFFSDAVTLAYSGLAIFFSIGRNIERGGHQPMIRQAGGSPHRCPRIFDI